MHRNILTKYTTRFRDKRKSSSTSLAVLLLRDPFFSCLTLLISSSFARKSVTIAREKIFKITTMEMINDERVDLFDSEPSALVLLFTEQWRGIFETHLVPKLKSRSELKFLKMAFKNARDAVERSKIKVGKKFDIREFTSLSQLELAWDNYHWDEDEYRGTQEDWFCSEVARMNKLEYLVWLREVKNCDWDSWTINMAALQGNLAMVKYCVDNGCPMDEDACEFAAENGHLDVLKYLHENDCPWSSMACYYAHSRNRIDCLNYLIDQKCPGFEQYVTLLAELLLHQT